MPEDIKNLLIGEEGYQESMEQIVKPYLAQRRTERWPEREPGKKLHLMCYRADQAKAVVVFSHGFTESEEKYAELIYYFLKEQYSVYFHEHGGHGYSYRLSDDLSLVHIDHFSTYIQDLLFISSMAREENASLPLYLFAHSMGGGIGAAAAARAPGLYDKVLLTSPMIRPVTGNTPWGLTGVVASLMCLLGKKKAYIFGGHPYDGVEDFETSCAMSRPRFDHYKAIRDGNEKLQTCAGSFGWLHGTVWLNRYLMNTAWKQIKAPVLLIQAEKETLVSTQQQELFISKLRRAGQAPAELAVIADAKHEIFNSRNPVLEIYLNKVFGFFN